MATKAAKPSLFEPSFRDDLLVIAPNGSATQIHPRYCLTNDSADALIGLLKDQGISAIVIQTAPLAAFEFGRWRTYGGGQTFNDTVPWVAFLDNPEGGVGTVMNAGLMADAFQHGYPYDYAVKYMLRGYAWDSHDQGFGPPPPMGPL